MYFTYFIFIVFSFLFVYNLYKDHKPAIEERKLAKRLRNGEISIEQFQTETERLKRANM